MGNVVLFNLLSLITMMGFGAACSTIQASLQSSVVAANVVFGAITLLTFFLPRTRNIASAFATPLCAAICISATIFEDDDWMFAPLALLISIATTALIAYTLSQEKAPHYWAISISFLQLIASALIIAEKNLERVLLLSAGTAVLMGITYVCYKYLGDPRPQPMRARA